MWKFLLVSSLVIVLATGDPPKKCCPDGTALLRRKNECWDPKSNTTSKILVLTCEKSLKFPNFTINSAGDVVVTLFKTEQVVVEHEKYCVGNVTTLRDVELKNMSVASVICADDERDRTSESISAYCMIVSVVFLLFTAIIYIALPEMRDLQGKSIVCFCIMFASALLLMGVMKLTTYRDMTLCAIRGFMLYYLILSAFFWSNAIAIQILRSIRRPSTMSYEWKDFAWYGVYAWLTPALFTAILAVLNYVPGDHPRPGIGLMTCWFYDVDSTKWYYLYSIWSALILANCCVFIYTFYRLWKNTFATNHLKALKYKFFLTVRLVIVFGITWIFEILGTLVEYNTFWFILDMINVCQGVFIFLVLVVFRRRVIKAMYKRGWLDCMSGFVEKHLAKADDDEQDVIEHTRDVPMDDK